MIHETFTPERLAVRPHIGIINMMGRNVNLRIYTVIADGDVWRWRVTYPNSPRIGATSTQAFSTRAEACRVAQNIAHLERPSICMLEDGPAFQNVPADAGQPAEYRDDWVGM